MIAGSQGSGKSSLSRLISEYLKKYYLKSTVIISLDNFYISKNKRSKLSKKFILYLQLEEFQELTI